jgi:hypothetical protein
MSMTLLAAAMIAEPLLWRGRVAYFLSFVAVLLTALQQFYGGSFFNGIVDTRKKMWPRWLFVALTLAVLIGTSLPMMKTPSWPQASFMDTLPRVAISLLLTWYASSAVFSSFFLGKGFAVFMHNPAAWLFGRNRSSES